MKLQTSEKIKFIIFVLILILVNIFFNWPYLTNLKKVKNELDQESRVLMQSANLNLDPQQTLKNYQTIKKELIDLHQVFLHEGEELDFIKRLEDVARKNKLIQKIDLNTSPQGINENIYKLELRLSLNGGYLDILNYLQDLTNFNYQLTVKYLDLKGSEQKLDLIILASSYWLYD